MSERWIGVDVGESNFSASLVDNSGELERRWNLSNSREERRTWLEEVSSLGPVALVLETTEAFSERLAEEAAAVGLGLYTVPSRALESFRRSEGFEDKDDELDGLLLAQMGVRGVRSVKPALVRTPLERHLRNLVRARSRLVDQLRVVKQQLRAVFLRLSPEVGSGSWQGPDVSGVSFRAIVKRWPDLLSLGRAHRKTITRVLRKIGRYGETRAEELADQLRHWSRGLVSVDQSRLEGAALEIQMACEQLELLDDQCRKLTRRIEDLVVEHPAGQRVLEAPGFGSVSAAWICAEAAPRARVMTEPQLATYSGLTPASRTSGKSGKSRLRRNVSRHLASTYYLSAVASLRCNGIDRRYYEKKRRDFQGHEAAHKKAVIALARQRHKMLFKLLSGERYDELKLTRSALERATRDQQVAPLRRPVEAAADDGVVDDPLESLHARRARVSPSHRSPTTPWKSLRDSHNRLEGRTRASGTARPPTAPTGPEAPGA